MTHNNEIWDRFSDTLEDLVDILREFDTNEQPMAAVTALMAIAQESSNSFFEVLGLLEEAKLVYRTQFFEHLEEFAEEEESGNSTV